jgi:hypothetical protein
VAPKDKGPIIAVGVAEGEVGPPQPSAKILTIKPLSKDEKDFIFKALPMVFFNRIKRVNGKSFPAWFKLKFNLSQCEPKGAATFDIDYMARKHPETLSMVLDYCKKGFEAVMAEYKPMVDMMINKYDYYAQEFKSIGERKFKAGHPTVDASEIQDIKNYLALKPVWDYMQAEEAKKWWKSYCKWFIRLNETPQGERVGDVTPEKEVNNAATAATGEPAPEPAAPAPPATPSNAPAERKVEGGAEGSEGK